MAVFLSIVALIVFVVIVSAFLIVRKIQDDRQAESVAVKNDISATAEDVASLSERVSVLEKTPAQFESKYSESTKKTCMEYYYDNKDILSIRQAARDMNIPYSTLCGWLKKDKQ